MQQTQIFTADRIWLLGRGYRQVGFTLFEFEKTINVFGAMHTVKALVDEPVQDVINRELNLFPPTKGSNNE